MGHVDSDSRRLEFNGVGTLHAADYFSEPQNISHATAPDGRRTCRRLISGDPLTELGDLSWDEGCSHCQVQGGPPPAACWRHSWISPSRPSSFRSISAGTRSSRSATRWRLQAVSRHRWRCFTWWRSQSPLVRGDPSSRRSPVDRYLFHDRHAAHRVSAKGRPRLSCSYRSASIGLSDAAFRAG